MPSSPIANSEKRHAKKGCLGVTECMEAWKNLCKFMWRLRIKDWVSMVPGLKGSGCTLPNETTTSVIRSQPIEHAKWDSRRGSLNDMASGHTSKQKNSWKGVEGNTAVKVLRNLDQKCAHCGWVTILGHAIDLTQLVDLLVWPHSGTNYSAGS